MKPKPCKVKFEIWEPLDPEKVPFSLFLCRGEHNHPPLPASKTPDLLRTELEEVMQQAMSPDLTPGRNAITMQTCSNYNCSAVPSVYAAQTVSGLKA